MTESNINKELLQIINTPDLMVMMNNYRKMVDSWVSEVNLKLNSFNSECPISLMNEVGLIFDRIKIIQEYKNYIDFVSILQGHIEQ